MHWLTCPNCDVIVEEAPHGRLCTEDGSVCYSCGAAGIIIGDILHFVNDWEGTWQYDDVQHWHNCDGCGEPCCGWEHSIDDAGNCEDCGATGLVVPCKHAFAPVEVTPATCTEDGLNRLVCSLCGEEDGNDIIPALGHITETKTTEATCIETGLTEKICTRCEEVVKSEMIPARPHDTWIKITPATCTEVGYESDYCYNCGKYLGSIVIPPLGHELITTDNGSAIVETCANCDYEKVTEKPAAAPVPTTEAARTVAPVVLPEDVVVKPVENVEIEVVREDGQEENEPAIAVVVNEVVMEDVAAVLPLPEEIETVMVLTLSMHIPEELEEQAEEIIPEQVTVAISMEEKGIEVLEGMRLVLVLADGTMIEIPFGIVDGKLIFTTTRMGVFAFVPVEEE